MKHRKKSVVIDPDGLLAAAADGLRKLMKGVIKINYNAKVTDDKLLLEIRDDTGGVITLEVSDWEDAWGAIRQAAKREVFEKTGRGADVIDDDDFGDMRRGFLEICAIHAMSAIIRTASPSRKDLDQPETLRAIAKAAFKMASAMQETNDGFIRPQAPPPQGEDLRPPHDLDAEGGLDMRRDEFFDPRVS